MIGKLALVFALRDCVVVLYNKLNNMVSEISWKIIDGS